MILGLIFHIQKVAESSSFLIKGELSVASLLWVPSFIHCYMRTHIHSASGPKSNDSFLSFQSRPCSLIQSRSPFSRASGQMNMDINKSFGRVKTSESGSTVRRGSMQYELGPKNLRRLDWINEQRLNQWTKVWEATGKVRSRIKLRRTGGKNLRGEVQRIWNWIKRKIRFFELSSWTCLRSRYVITSSSDLIVDIFLGLSFLNNG